MCLGLEMKAKISKIDTVRSKSDMSSLPIWNKDDSERKAELLI